MNNNGVIRIGTSGIVVPGTKADFPDAFKSGTRLHYYGSLFDTLEINSSFYRLPLPSTFAKWVTEVPEYFKFTVKLWRNITHVDKLDFKRDDIDVFMRSISYVDNKSGCILIQFPQAIGVSYKEKVEQIIQHINSLDSLNRWRLTIEFRNKNWYQEEIYRMLGAYGVSLVFHDMPKSKTPLNNLSSNLVYCRFHGPTGNYKGSYEHSFLQEYADRIKVWSKQGKDIYVYFNNTLGAALENSELLKTLI